MKFKYVGVICVGLLLCISVIPNNAKAASSDFIFYVTPCGYGTVNSINDVNDTVNFNGTELIIRLEIVGNATIASTGFVGQMSYVSIFSERIGNRSVYINKLHFDENALISFIFYLSDGSSGRVSFNVTGSNYTYI